MPMPLEGLRVLDWTIWQQGPVCSAMLADLGAEVIKLESRDGGDPGRGLVSIGGAGLAKRPNFYFEANNRNKKSLTLDLKHPEAREIVYELAAGEPGMPPRPIAGGIADQMGAVVMAYGVLAALVARERFGMGQEVDAS